MSVTMLYYMALHRSEL